MHKIVLAHVLSTLFISSAFATEGMTVFERIDHAAGAAG
jgi:uncharacterized protein (DUF302 family)